MSMRRRAGEKRAEMWIATSDLACSSGHPFYVRLNAILAEVGFDRHVEKLREGFSSSGSGRPSNPPGAYMRMLFVGVFRRSLFRARHRVALLGLPGVAQLSVLRPLASDA